MAPGTPAGVTNCYTRNNLFLIHPGQGRRSAQVDVSPGRWIQLNADNTFAYARSGGLTSATRQNETATYSITGKLETSGTARGSLDISQASFDENGTHYTCTGAPHGFYLELN